MNSKPTQNHKSPHKNYGKKNGNNQRNHLRPPPSLNFKSNPETLEPVYDPKYPTIGPESNWMPRFENGAPVGAGRLIDYGSQKEENGIRPKQRIEFYEPSEFSIPYSFRETPGIYFAHLKKLVGDGNCYFRAMALHVYGDEGEWALVKGEHLQYLETVLRDKRHPRYGVYSEMNQISSPTRNLWQRLLTPYEWQIPYQLAVLTADIYELYVVVFEMDGGNDMVKRISVTGNANSRHVFLRTWREKVGWLVQGVVFVRGEWRVVGCVDNPVTKGWVLPKLIPRPVIGEVERWVGWLVRGWNKVGGMDIEVLKKEVEEARKRREGKVTMGSLEGRVEGKGEGKKGEGKGKGKGKGKMKRKRSENGEDGGKTEKKKKKKDENVAGSEGDKREKKKKKDAAAAAAENDEYVAESEESEEE